MVVLIYVSQKQTNLREENSYDGFNNYYNITPI
jgi:hypothetical protein